MNRPFEYACRSQPTLATVIGVRANATAMLVPSSIVVGVLGRQHQRQERVVVDLGCPAAVVAPSLQRGRSLGDVGELAGNGPVDLEAAAVTHTR